MGLNDAIRLTIQRYDAEHGDGAALRELAGLALVLPLLFWIAVTLLVALGVVP